MPDLRPLTLRAFSATLIALAASLALAPQAYAQAFETRLDCGGDFAPGATVPIEITVENMTNEDIPVDAVISIDVPGRGLIDLRAAPFLLRGGQNYVNQNQTIRLPDSAPIADDYIIWITVDSADLMTFDTCDIDVR